MADRGLCATCGGDFAVAKDGTPYKHTAPGGDQTCPGSDLPIQVLASEAVYRVYGGEVTDYRFVVIGPVSSAEEHPESFVVTADGQEIPLLGTPASNSADDVNALLPEGQGIPVPAAAEEPDQE